MNNRFFSTEQLDIPGVCIEFREEAYTGFRSRIVPSRIRRVLESVPCNQDESAPCPFCLPCLSSSTPTFPDGTRLRRGESVTFPNRYPFAQFHTVTVVTQDHKVASFRQDQIADALYAQVVLLSSKPGFPSINWNYLLSAGASLSHPHMQGQVDVRPDFFLKKYIEASESYFRDYGTLYREDCIACERRSPRYLCGDDLFWYAHPVPVGEREIRCLLPFAEISSFESYIDSFAQDLLTVLDFYRKTGTEAFTMSLFFDKTGDVQNEQHFAFCSIIARINPNRNGQSDSTYMERIHQEPVIRTFPENLGTEFRAMSGLSSHTSDL